MVDAQVQQVAAQLGVSEGQIARDMLISHALYALRDEAGLIFFGGTALCRSYLAGFRLSEDIDLLADDATALRRRLTDLLPEALRRHYPGTSIHWVRDGLTWVGYLETVDGLRVRIQVVPTDDSYRRYPSRPTAIGLRYDPLPADVTLAAPTVRAFAAMKLNAWAERRTLRDLADLFALHGRGALDADAVRLATEASHAVQPAVFSDDLQPTDHEWEAALAAQMAEPPDRVVAFRTVRAAVARLKGWSQAQEWGGPTAH